MTACPWETIDSFDSFSEFERFVEWMGEQVISGAAKEVVVREPYIGATTFREKWFEHSPSGETWRLVWPDAPFAGIFERVN